MIHPTAQIDSSSEIDEGVSIGPFTVIGPNVKIYSGTVIEGNAFIHKNTLIGKNNLIFPFASIGGDPQDLKYKGEETYLEIGDHNEIREGSTINRGTVQEEGKTIIGNNNLLMAYTHVAHDCIVGNNVIMANIATLGGHVEIGDWCNIGGGAMIHQFVKIGRQSLIGGGFSAKQDVPPFIIGAGIPLRFVGINKIGLERRKFSEDVRALIKKTYRTYFKSKLNRGDALKKIKNEISQIDEVKEIVSFIESSSRGII